MNTIGPITSLGDPSAIKSALNAPSVSEEEKIAEVTRQFESIFLRNYLKDALKPLVKGAINESGGAHKIYRQFMTDVIADSISQTGPMGVSNVLQAQLQSKQSLESDEQ